MRARCRDDGVAARHRRMHDCPIVRWQARRGNRRAVGLRRASGAAACGVARATGAPRAPPASPGTVITRPLPPIASPPTVTSDAIALVLPLESTAYGPAADAVRAGFLAAAKRAGISPRIRVIGHGDDGVLPAIESASNGRRRAGRRAVDPRRPEDRVGHGAVASADACAQPARRRLAVARQHLCVDALIRQRRRSARRSRARGRRAQRRHRREQRRAAASIRSGVRRGVAGERRASTRASMPSTRIRSCWDSSAASSRRILPTRCCWRSTATTPLSRSRFCRSPGCMP